MDGDGGRATARVRTVAGPTKSDEETPVTLDEVTAVDVVRGAFDALNERDRATFVDLHTEDVVVHVGSQVIRGADSIADEEFSHFEAFPDLRVEPDAIVAEDRGDTVAMRWTAIGTHEGDFRGTPPTGARVEYQLMGMFRVEDGQIAGVWLVSDRLTLLQQLGVFEPPTDRA